MVAVDGVALPAERADRVSGYHVGLYRAGVVWVVVAWGPLYCLGGAVVLPVVRRVVVTGELREASEAMGRAVWRMPRRDGRGRLRAVASGQTLGVAVAARVMEEGKRW